MKTGEEQKRQIAIPTCRIPILTMLMSSHFIPAKEAAREMLIRRRIERLERTSPPTIASLVDRIEREAMNAVSRDQGTSGDIPGSDVGDVEQSSGGRYKAALSDAVKQVSNEDLDRMILYCEPNANRSELRQ